MDCIIQEQGWFFNNISYTAADKLLLMKGNVTGTFLVRTTESPSGYHELLVRDDSVVKHYLIREEYATTVDDLQRYARDADGLQLCTNLIAPCPMRAPYDDWEINLSSIELKSKLKDGEFGEVWKGTWKDTIAVAVKVSKYDSICLSEAQFIMRLQHDKVIKLYGIYEQESPFRIVTELMTQGNLLDYLRIGEGQHLTFPELMGIGAQVANGMAYLESQHCIHRDLCAKNVLVGERNTVKIGGFRLAWFLVNDKCPASEEDYYPLKWTAPEVTINREFNNKCDIWSFGVFLTELVTHGCQPYPRMTNDEVLEQTNRGYRMPPSPGCPDNLYQVMLECWKTDHEERPTFDYVVQKLKDYSVSLKERYAPEVVQVQFEYQARHPDELTIRVGDIIRNCRPMYKGWLKGELNDKMGIFPDNYVVKPGPVEVQYEYEAMEPDELTIHVGDIIRNCRPIGNGWLEGELNGKVGVFPGNFVVKLVTVQVQLKFEAMGPGELTLCIGDIVRNCKPIKNGWFKGELNGKIGEFPSNHVVKLSYDDLINLELISREQDWFFDNINLNAAEKLLLKKGNVTGTFLVRTIERPSAYYELLVRDGDNVNRYYIRKDLSTTMDELQHYARDADGLQLCTQLTTPCPMRTPDDNWEIECSFMWKSKLYDRNSIAIWKGTWKGTIPIVIKALKSHSNAVIDFFSEVEIMKKLRHDNLIKLYGVCTQEKPFCFVTELMKHGSLLDYMTKGEGKYLKLPELIDIGAQVANGMAYLESQHYVHRDLRADNILVGEGIVVKIGNFSLARFLVNGKYFPNKTENLPIKWTAPEAAKSHQFSAKSDIWSFGVFLTELVTHGRTPYSGMTNNKVLKRVRLGYIMPQSSRCPDYLYQIMLQCWKPNPAERPTFNDIKHWLYFVPDKIYDNHTDAFGIIQLQEQGWFVDKIRRTDAVNLLLMDGNVTGTFLVRTNENSSANYELLVRDNNIVKSYNVRKEYATTVDDLEHYARHEDESQLHIHLTTPCPMRTPYDDWEIEYRSIELRSKLCDGKFNRVWQGLWNNTIPVAVKTPKLGSLALPSFMAEAQIMKKLQHKQIIKLYAVCTQKYPLFIVTELMMHSNLLDHLTKGQGQHLKLPKLIDIGAQVANGMAYLESQHYVHRDLMARNILVGKGNTVKIGGFNLAQLLVDGKYLAQKGDKFPVRWTAPEAFMLNEYTTMCDVWSFGVFLTELVTHGHIPYPCMTNNEVIARVKQWHRMPRPPGCPEPLYQIILKCCKIKPEERFSFDFFKNYLKKYSASVAEAYHATRV